MRRELVLVVVLAAALLVPGIWRYSLVDPWETHYGEVARTMLADGDYVHTKWNGTSSGNPKDIEGFRSKPVLMFWLMATGMRAVGVGDDGGYSGELASTARTMLGMRIPFIACAIAGLALVWFMLARLVSRRLAWFAFGVIATTPMFCLIARQAIPDMPMVACTMGAVALFILATEDDRPASKRAVQITLGLVGLFVLLQAIAIAVSFIHAPQLALRNVVVSPALWLPLLMAVWFGALWREGWLIMRLPCVLVGGVICAIRGERLASRRPFEILEQWEKQSLDRYLVAALPVVVLAIVLPLSLPRPTLVALIAFDAGLALVWGYLLYTGGWPALWRLADRALAMQPITTTRQLYLVGCAFLLAVGLLAKGPPGFAVVVVVVALHTALLWRWRDNFEIKRGLLVIAAVALPWHIGMYLKEGLHWLDEYVFTHIINRATANPDNSIGTFAFYTDQIGHGMWLWAALLPAALVGLIQRATPATRDGRVRLLVGLWAIASVFVFCFVQTKFNHYILPAIPALGVAVAFFLDDLFARRERMHAVYGALAIGIILLVCRDLSHEPDRWIEMFVYRADRPWPTNVDASDGFLVLAMFAVAGVIALCISRWGVIVVGAAGLAISLWALHVYMPLAGTNWGMGDAFAKYYDERTIYGHKRVFYDARECTHLSTTFETHVPANLQLGQPMTLTYVLGDDTLVAPGRVSRIGDHEITVEPFARDQLTAFEQRCAKSPKRGKPSLAMVDADRMIAWQLYWRGEQFWSGGEIWGKLPEQKTSFPGDTNQWVERYLNDRSVAPLGRRYFVITNANRVLNMRNVLPTARAKESLQVLDTTSNKFWLAAFYL